MHREMINHLAVDYSGGRTFKKKRNRPTLLFNDHIIEHRNRQV